MTMTTTACIITIMRTVITAIIIMVRRTTIMGLTLRTSSITALIRQDRRSPA
jgi:hypothetical protein